MSKQTISLHLADCKEVATVIAEANALLVKAKEELESARRTLETLQPFMHPLHKVGEYESKRLTNRDSCTPEDLAKAQVARINALLGDRA